MKKLPKFLLGAFLLSLCHPALADTAVADPGKSMLLQLPIVLALFALFYFGLIRPQKAQQQKHLDFIQGLSRGDEIVTTGGIIGTINGLTDKVVTLQVAPGTEVKIMRSQVQGRLKDAIV